MIRQRGLGGVFVAVVLLLVAVGALAVLALSRATRSVERGGEVAARFASLQAALVQFVAANERLPCPANPALDDGVEVGGGAAACGNATGTVPWKTIGARRDDGMDPWGQKISYRVYTGAAGSLTQTKGASMVNCDTSDAGPRDGNGLCVPAPRDTGPAAFLAGKGLALSDQGTARTDAAYVLISHGPTGLGAYTSNGTQRELPAPGGDERANTEATGPFVIKAFSAPGTEPTSAAHFDDFLAYRSVEDLIRAAGVYARNWPEDAAPSGTTSSVTFDQATVDAAVGSPVTPGSGVGQVSVNFIGVVASGFASSSSTAEIAFDVVAGTGGLGVAGGGSALLQSSANERLRISLAEAFTRFAVTLNDFGLYGGQYDEIVELRFFLGESPVGSPRYGFGCNLDGGLASFETDVGQLFDTVEITPIPAIDVFTLAPTGITAFLVSDVKACTAADPTCTTSLANPGNTCGLS